MGAKMSEFLYDRSSFLPHVAFPVDRFEPLCFCAWHDSMLFPL